MIIGGIEIDFVPEFGNLRHMKLSDDMGAQAAKIEKLMEKPSTPLIEKKIKAAQSEIIRLYNQTKQWKF